jgi:hypothetical protein
MKVSKGVLNELRSLSRADADLALGFMKHLATNPYDPTLLKTATAKGDLFASSVTDNIYLYRSLDVEGRVPDWKTTPKINVLGLAQKSASHGLAPLGFHMDEKLKPA